MLLVMSRSVSFATDEYYHIYNRGVEKRTIYLDEADHRRFTCLLYLANSTHSIHLQKLRPPQPFGRGRTLTKVFEIDRGETLVDIQAYCLMPNHFHLLLRAKDDVGVSKFMQKLCTGYTMYFNKRYKRAGTLFEGKFKSTHADSDEYLKYLYAYIHLNPVKLIQPDWKKNGLTDLLHTELFLHNYQYSSYNDHRSIDRPEKTIINAEAGPSYFSSVADLEREMQDWLTLQARSDLDEVEVRP